MKYYVSQPFHDERAEISFSEPTIPYFTVEELPEGDGRLIVIEGTLVRVDKNVPNIIMGDPFEAMRTEVSAALNALTEGLL